ncbi:polysaccharide deacetylase family protein [Ruminococcus sp. 5_1_39BFAA]|uniref:polysaccharide deacetylase family protein n=1 Tax=Ruminococcus sp. 5_1_39BFAA TaxID=457412 RepID=UPI0035687714
MPGRKQRTNKALALLAVLLCLGCGTTLTQSSATTSPISDKQMPDMFVAENVDDSAIKSDGTVAENTDPGGQDVPASPEVPVETPTPEPTPTPVPQSTPPETSPEAASGVWTPQGSNWYFMVNGVALTGWLTDTDGHRYYFDANGVMQTGWLEADGNRYYLNADGVMQTGDVVIEGQLYHFGADGAQQGDPTPVQDGEVQPKTFAYISSTEPPAAEATPETIPDAAAVEPEAVPDAAAADPEDSPDAAATDPEAASDAPAEQPQEPRKKLALTFDDGPSDFTDRLLDCLEANNAKATFFLVGKEILNFPEPLSRMEALGCEIGNHSYDHTDFTTLSAEGISSQLSQTDQEITNLVGHAATVIRPPYGAINDTVSAATDRPMILWSVDTLDWETQDVDQTVQNVLDNAQDGAIILMHDIYKATVDAAEILIPKLIEQGYDLVTIHELAADKGIELQPGVSYGSFTG